MKTYEGVRGDGGVRVIVKEDGKTIGVTGPFATWEEAEEWEREQKAEWDQHEDPPILVNADYFEQKPFTEYEQKEEFRRFTIIYAQRMEEHITHLVRLLETQGITCQCTEQKASPQCMIHVRDNLPSDGIDR